MNSGQWEFSALSSVHVLEFLLSPQLLGAVLFLACGVTSHVQLNWSQDAGTPGGLVELLLWAEPSLGLDPHPVALARPKLCLLFPAGCCALLGLPSPRQGLEQALCQETGEIEELTSHLDR